MGIEITLPHRWKPRDYQMDVWKYFETGGTRAVSVLHRRGGKDLTFLNLEAVESARRPGLYWHMLPTQKQGRKVIWEGMDREGRRFLDYFPGFYDIGETDNWITRKRDDEMSLWFANGSKFQVVGAEDPDTLVGANPVGVVFSEYPVYSDSKVWQLIKPILRENGGWAAFAYTPRGKNHGYRQMEIAEKSPRWFCEVKGIDVTGVLTEEDMDEEREEGMSEALIQQEYYVSFDAPVEGSYYGDLMLRLAEQEGRIGTVDWEPMIPVETWWDLGMRDATCIWYIQQVGKELHAIDFDYDSGVGLDVYMKIIADKPYVYGKHLVPHDAKVRELGAAGGNTRVETARLGGLYMTVVDREPHADGINAVRKILPRFWFDDKKCKFGLDGLRNYKRKQIKGQSDPDGNPLYSREPDHDWASHPADAFRIGALGHRDRQKWGDDDDKPMHREVAIV
jgi:hypothetical protein